MKPTPIQRYNGLMGSVDLVDQLLEPYDPTRKSYTWFKKLGLYMITRMVLISRVIYQNLNPHHKPIEYLDFLKKVIHEILLEHSLGYAAMQVCEERPKKKKKRHHAASQQEPVAGPSREPVPPCSSTWIGKNSQD